MKRLVSSLFVALVVFLIAGCGNPLKEGYESRDRAGAEKKAMDAAGSDSE